nr:MAG TPA: hypothetical protein [Caudoviricetes sp.]
MLSNESSKVSSKLLKRQRVTRRTLPLQGVIALRSRAIVKNWIRV